VGSITPIIYQEKQRKMGCGFEVRTDRSVWVGNIEKKLSNHSAGYKVVWIDGKLKYVHRLVAEKFIPNPNNKSSVNHINGIKDDNRVENLEWTTSQENLQHAIQNSLWGKNIIEKRKFTETEIYSIRNEYIPRKNTYNKIAKKYKVDYRTIYDIVNKKSYKEII